jgi:hemolysin activation/secretion protein
MIFCAWLAPCHHTPFRLLLAVLVWMGLYGGEPGMAHAAESQAAETMRNGTSEAAFDILEFDVEGNSRLSDLAIERAVMAYLGEGKTGKDVEAARTALEKAYHDAGYLTVLVNIPEQKVDEGIVTLLVVEGQVARLRVKGSDYHLASRIKENVPELAEGNVPYFPAVQRQLEGVNRGADMKATPVLKAGRNPGTVDVTLDVEDQLPLHGNIELSNKQTPFTTPLRLSASVRYDNLWQRAHSINLTAQTTPQDTAQTQVFAGTYVMPVGDSGDALAAYAVHSSSNVPAFPTGVLGNSDIFGVRYALRLTGTANYSHSLSLGVDRKDVRQTLLVGGAGGVTSQTPSITYVPLVASYNGGWLRNNGSTLLDASITTGIRGLFGNTEGEFAAKRSGASADYVVTKAGLKHTQSLGRWSLSGRVEGQFASGPLVPTEQYSAGGVDTVRGYFESERLGDDALRLSFEGRTPGYQFSDRIPLRVTGIAFFEGARLRTRQPLFPTPDTFRVRGAGLGLRVSGMRGLSFDLDWARALDDAQITRAGDYRVLARLGWDY